MRPKWLWLTVISCTACVGSDETDSTSPAAEDTSEGSGDTSEDAAGGTSEDSGGTSGPGATSTGNDPETSAAPDSDEAGSAEATGDPDSDAVPPPAAAELVPWLEAGTYLGWAAESGIHPSTGPHFGDVRTFVNAPLIDALQAGATEHPVGAATVKELYANGDQVRGWSVSLKVSAGTGGDTWYWFEVYDGSVLAEGEGHSACVGCHAGGSDYVLTPFPLQ